MAVYAHLRAFLIALAPAWRATRTTNLARLASAVLRRRSLCLSELARSYPGGLVLAACGWSVCWQAASTAATSSEPVCRKDDGSRSACRSHPALRREA